MPFKKYIRRNIYKWHRITSLIVAIPVLLWTVSGFLHPVMSSFKPQVKSQTLPDDVIDTSKIKISLHQVLKQHGIGQLQQFRIVKMHSAFYYQVKHQGVDSLSYISCYNAQWLPKGDEQYAAYLAQRFLIESNGGQNEPGHHGFSPDAGLMLLAAKPSSHFQNTNIESVDLVTSFDNEYKKSNVLLPVYRVQFYRNDHIRLFVETSTGKLAVAVDDTKAWFNRFFSITHSWSFLDGAGVVKNILIGLVSLLCFFTSLFGFYVYQIINKKKTPVQTNKRVHRVLGNVFVATTMLYALSGAWHSFHKPFKKDVEDFSINQQFASNEVDLSLSSLLRKLSKDEKLCNVSIVKLDNKNHWQTFINKNGKKAKRYFEIPTLIELQDGDTKYGRYLASCFAQKNSNDILTSKQLIAFNHEYSMMNKRLPVVEVAFKENGKYFVETSTGKLAAVIRPADKAERFSFSNLHMHHYWEMWLGKEKGKPFKNAVLMATTFGLLLLAFTGLLIYYKKRKQLRQG